MHQSSSQPHVDRALHVAVIIAATTAILGCPGFGNLDPAAIDTTAPQCEQVQEILNRRCATCHGATPSGGAPAGYRLDSLTDTTSGPGAATLIGQILAQASTNNMPPAGSIEGQVTAAELDVLVAWSNAGTPISACTNPGGGDAGFDAGDGGLDGSGQPVTDAGDDARVPPDVRDAPPTTDEVHAAVFANCTPCHYGNQLPYLELDDAFESRVTMASTQVASMPWITPGDADESYLFHKISGTHLDVGGSGVRMPESGQPLSAEQIALVEDWIERTLAE